MLDEVYDQLITVPCVLIIWDSRTLVFERQVKNLTDCYILDVLNLDHVGRWFPRLLTTPAQLQLSKSQLNKI